MLSSRREKNEQSDRREKVTLTENRQTNKAGKRQRKRGRGSDNRENYRECTRCTNTSAA